MTRYHERGGLKQHTLVVSQWVRSPGGPKLGPLLRVTQAASHRSARAGVYLRHRVLSASQATVGSLPSLAAVELTMLASARPTGEKVSAA